MFEAAAQAGEGGGRGARSGGAGGAAGGDANLDFLRNNPHFQQLRQLVQQQPQMLEPILQQVAAGNPQIAQIIGQNSEQFLQLLAEDLGEDDEALPPGTQAISVTEEERDAIERVCIRIQSRYTVWTYLTDFFFTSCAVWASLGIPSSRPTLPAIRTRSWPPTSCSTSRMMTRSKHGRRFSIFLLSFFLRSYEYQSCYCRSPTFGRKCPPTLHFPFPSESTS